MLTVRWFFLAQFSNFRSLSRRKFAHIFYTYTNFRRNKKKVRSRFYSQMTLMLGIFLQSNVFQHNAMSIKENLKNDIKKTEGNRKKNYKKHFNSQTLAFIVDYLNSCNKHPFFYRSFVVTFVIQTWNNWANKLQAPQYSQHPMVEMGNEQTFFSLRFHICSELIFFSLAGWDSLIQYWNFHRILHFYRWNIFIGIHKNHQKCRVFFFFTKFNGFFLRRFWSTKFLWIFF